MSYGVGLTATPCGDKCDVPLVVHSLPISQKEIPKK
jgi:hypothetical protein